MRSPGGTVTGPHQRRGPADLATTQIDAHALSERRRAAVMALDVGIDRVIAPRTFAQVGSAPSAAPAA